MSRTLRLKNRQGFSLLEVMIVVLVISVLTAIAIPAFLGARTRSQTRACCAHLRQIKYAKETWAMATRQSAGGVPEWPDIYPDYIKEMPECPGGGEYTIRAVGEDPICSVGEKHVAP